MKLSITQQKELDELRHWLIAIVDYFVEQKYDFMDSMHADIEEFYNKKELKGFRLAYQDINSIALDLPADQLTELNKRLTDTFGKNLFDSNKKLEKKIQGIRKRAKVRNEEEYRLIKVYLDTLGSESDKEYNELQNMNLDYELS